MSNGKVAVIADDRKLLREIEGILLRGGYTSVPVNARSAVDDVVSGRPDAILLEFGIAEKDGLELITAINRVCESRRIPVIGVSDFLREECGRLPDLCELTSWLKKPFQPLDMIWAIESGVVDARFKPSSNLAGCC